MADPFVAEIRIFPFNFAPFGWSMCQGQILSISQNTALFSLLGVNFGGNGTSNFGLPNLQGNVPVGQGQGPGLTNYGVGQTGGTTTVTLTQQNLPSHSHTAACSGADGNDYGPANDFWSVDVAGGNEYAPAATANSFMAATALTAVGGNQPHNNLQPYLALNYCIALQGIYPPRS